MLENCPNCGYSTAGLRVSKCPECGSNVPDEPDVPPLTAPHPAIRHLLSIGMTMLTLAVASFEAFVPGTPQPWAVMPLTVILPAFVLWPIGFLVLIAVAYALAYPIRRGVEEISNKQSSFAYGMLALAWCWMIFGARYAVRYQGVPYLVTCVLAQAAFTGLILCAERINAKRRDFASASVYQLIVSIWLASYAFPYMGELP